MNFQIDRADSPQQWDEIFEQLLPLLQSEEFEVCRSTIDRIKKAIESERKQAIAKQQDGQQILEQRLNRICESISIAAQTRLEIFEEFCSSFSSKYTISFYRNFILKWLDRLSEIATLTSPSQEDILAAKILFSGFGSTWQEAGEKLLEAIDHPNLTVRACAANQLGKFANLLACEWSWEDGYAEDILTLEYEEDGTWKWCFEARSYEDFLALVFGVPSVNELMDLMAEKEIDRPGVAGAFLNGLEIADTAKSWILDMLEKSPTPEPYIRYFPCSLAFLAHEICSKDAPAIRRLIDMGRTDIAIMAATEENIKLDAIEPLLIELGYDNNPLTVRLASSHLAYYYHYLHPQGAELGYVENIDDLPDIDLFLLFSKFHKSPYAGIIYPKEKGGSLSRSKAKKWLDRILPKSLRGEGEGEWEPALLSSQNIRYRCGLVDYQETIRGKSKAIAQVIISYRSDLPWNPKQLLEFFRSPSHINSVEDSDLRI